MTLIPILDKDLPDIKPEDIKLDTSNFDKLGVKEQEVVKSNWVASQRSNEQLVLLIDQIPKKIDRINIILATQKEPDKSLVDKIVRLKEEYAVCINEITLRKKAVK